MKSRSAQGLGSRLARYTAVALGTVSVTLATPQMEPSSDTESSEFLEVDLQSDTEMNKADIDVTLVDGIATLRGSADSLAQVERASLRAYDSPRVMVVVNEVRIVPATGAQVKSGVREAFDNQIMFEDEGIKVRADGSRVTLTGKVGTLDEAELARELASEITGVTAVDNDLKVDFDSIRSNEQIEKQLAFEVSDNPLFAGLQVAPEVKDGVVTWSGQVGSRNDFDSLVAASYVTGVIDVDTSKLKINGDLDVIALEEKDYTAAQSEEAIEVVISKHSKTANDDIEADFKDGVAILSGTVDDHESLHAALLNTRAIPGVDRVENRLKIDDVSDLISANVAPRTKSSSR